MSSAYPSSQSATIRRVSRDMIRRSLPRLGCAIRALLPTGVSLTFFTADSNPPWQARIDRFSPLRRDRHHGTPLAIGHIGVARKNRVVAATGWRSMTRGQSWGSGQRGRGMIHCGDPGGGVAEISRPARFCNKHVGRVSFCALRSISPTRTRSPTFVAENWVAAT